MTRVAIYARVSTRDKGQDCENQLRQLEDFVRRMEWQFAKQYIDQVSGKTENRPAFREMFAAASRREFDVVLFWSLDRFSREGVLETLNHLQRLSSYGVGFRSFTEQYLDSCGIFKDAVLSILATIAKQERVRLSERVMAGLETARAKGKRLGRPQRFFDREKAEKMRSQGKSWRVISKEMGVPCTSIREALEGK